MKKKTSKPVEVAACNKKIGARTDVESIRSLINLMTANDMNEVFITDGDLKIRLKRGVANVVAAAAPSMMMSAPASAAPAAAVSAAAAPAAAPAVAKSSLIEIKSPMVGTFYAAPSPDSDPFVKVGTSVSDDSTVCIVEAMKVMNEIKAECSGTIAEVCVKNAQPVEYGQVLFRVKPS